MKKEDNKKLYSFKSGMFYIFIGEDALFVNKIIGLKLLNLNEDILKCGFSRNSLEKYMNLFMENDLKVLIVDDKKVVNYDEQYLENVKVIDFINKIKKMDINTITPLNALAMLNKFKKDIKDA